LIVATFGIAIVKVVQYGKSRREHLSGPSDLVRILGIVLVGFGFIFILERDMGLLQLSLLLLAGTTFWWSKLRKRERESDI
jgi:hypothetical protein